MYVCIEAPFLFFFVQNAKCLMFLLFLEMYMVIAPHIQIFVNSVLNFWHNVERLQFL